MYIRHTCTHNTATNLNVVYNPVTRYKAPWVILIIGLQIVYSQEFDVLRIFDCRIPDVCFNLLLPRQGVDQADVHERLSHSGVYLWDSVLHQLHCHLLPRLQSHPLWHNGETSVADNACLDL